VAQVDQWLDFHNSEIDPTAFTTFATIAGWAPASKEKYTEAKRGLKEAAKTLDSHLKGRKFLVGESVTIADITIASVLSIPFRILFDEATRKSLPHLTEWFLGVSGLPAFQSVLGKAWLCQKEFEVHFPEDKKEHHHDKPVEKVEKKPEEKKEKKKEEPKKEQPKKEQPKKEEKKKEEKKKKKDDDDEEEEEPDYFAKKKVNPLDVLPPTPFKLDDFKREISNAPDRHPVLKEFWTKYDPAGWSLWKVVYQKY
jgi:elongation factor 1-gamma